MARRVATYISLEGVQQVVSGLKQVGSAAKSTADDVQGRLGKALDSVNRHSGTINQLGRGFTIAGLAAATGLAAVTKAAMDWESAWAGVQKTTDGTAGEMAILEDQLRSMARTMPATHTEIAAVAEAAGQLGVQREAVAGFTRTMIQLGETTNLTAETAATQLAQLMNIMGTSQADVGRLGAALVALGNDGASTEAEILALSQRLAAAGSQARMSEADVLGMANAMASVGIEAEAGGTAMSMTLKQIDAAVRESGDKLELIAKTAGMSAEEFKTAWGQDAASAVASFVEGLGGMQSAGQDVNGLLSDLGINAARQTDTLLRLAGAGDLLSDSLSLGAQAFEESSALAEEYAKRADTTAARTQVAWNNIRDAAISTGQQMLPVVAQIADGVAAVARAFGGMPEGSQAFVLGTTAVIAAGGLTIGALSKLVTTVAEVRAGLQAMGVSARTASASMGAIGVALAVAGLALGAWIGKQAEANAAAQQYADAIRQQGAAVGEYTAAVAARNLEEQGALRAAETLGLSLRTVADAATGNAAAYETVRDRISEVKQASFDWTDQSNVEVQAALTLEKSLGMQSDAYSRAAEARRREAEAAGEAADATDESARASLADEMAKRLQNQAIQAQEQALRGAIDAAQSYGNQLLALSGSNRGVEAAIDSATESLERNGATLDETTAAGRANGQALDDLAAAGMRQIEVLAAQGASTGELAERSAYLSQSYVDAATSMGMSEDQAWQLADAFFAIPAEVSTTVEVPGALDAAAQAADVKAKLDALPPETLAQIVSLWNSGQYDAAMAALAAADGRVATTYIDTYHRTFVSVQQQAGSIIGPGGITQADGGIVEFYRNGGVRRDPPHVAQLVPAGSWRMFGEPETGGEAYLPLGWNKRAQSLPVLEEVASRFGYALVRRFADGGFVPAPGVPFRTAAGLPGVDEASLAVAISRALGSRPLQVQVLVDGREIAGTVRAYDRGLR